MEEYFFEKKYEKEDIENYIDLNQKKNFSNFLEFICQSKKINISEQNAILETLREKLIIYLLNNREYLDEYIIANLVMYQNIIKDLINNEKSLIDFIKLINFIKVFTLNINMTSQVMSNCLNIINNLIEEYINKSNDLFEINENSIFPILKLIELNLDLSININSYNPRLIIFISRVLNFLIQNKNNNNNKINNINIYYPDAKDTKKINYNKFITERIEEIIEKLSINSKNDINYEIIFKEIYEIINANDIFKNNFSKFILDYKDKSQKNFLKKKIHMNYLVIKKKPIQFLQPDFDLSFLGDFPEYVNIEEKNKKMNYILKHKTRNTEKQAIRKLKKEAKVLDEEREKVIDDINKKRKEDLKFVNQYLEQQNIEYKKMMSSNERKRFKFKKKKTGK
jgi:hypothetical protein